MEFKGLIAKKTKSVEWKPSISLGNESLLFNGSFYNYFQIMKEYEIENESKTQSEVLIKLLKIKGVQALNLINADYAIAYLKNNKLFLIRDLIGTKPLFYSDDDSFFKFSDEVLEKGVELAPGTLLEYNISNGSLKLFERTSFESSNYFSSFEESVEEFAKHLFRSVSSRVYNLSRMALFDNGLPEFKIIQKLCKDLDCDFKVFSQAFDETCVKAGKEGYKVIISSYGLRKIFNNDLNFEIKEQYYAAKKNNLDIRYPFLDPKLIQTILMIRSADRRRVLQLVSEQFN
ncbi:MAG: hypothetical protein JW791_03680 [Nanoarchaeota archaeon]|nr:hypothetical protein [Nanoarchaeota archaeon]